MDKLISGQLVPSEHIVIKNASDFFNHYPTTPDNILIKTTTKRPGLSLSFSRPASQIIESNASLVNILKSTQDEISCEFVYNSCSVEFSNNGSIWMPKYRNSSESLTFDNVDNAIAHYTTYFGPDSCCHCGCKGNTCCHCNKNKF